MKLVVVVLNVCSLVAFSQTVISEDPVITLPDGKIQGRAYVTGTNKTYYGFRRIPYATPPVGNLRFEPPQPNKPWNGTLDASQDSKICISSGYLYDSYKESEDCLYINVYVPILKPEVALPVMVWVYGGGFTDGNALKSYYGPDYLVERDVIVVTFNYRVGPMGFISTGDQVLPGNMGLKDQNLAFKWVQNNIEHFGGDVKKVTVFGQSAGATSIGLHLVSPKSAGLFRAAILESGSALVHWSVDWHPRQTAFAIADAIPGGNYGNDTQALKEFLKKRSVAEIVRGFGTLPALGHPYPTIEEESDTAFITGSHYEALVKGEFNQVPILIGVCAEEALLSLKNLDYATKTGKALDAAPETVLADDLRPNASEVATVSKKIKDIYLKEGETFAGNLVGLVEYYSDNRYTRGTIKHAQVAANFVPVYLYEFAYYPRERIITKAYIEGAEKAAHAAELPLLFNITDTPLLNSSNPDDDLAQNRIVTLWTNFVKYLNPTPERSELLNNVIWPTVTNPQRLIYLSFNDTLEIRQDLKKVSFGKWNEIYKDYGAKPFITF